MEKLTVTWTIQDVLNVASEQDIHCTRDQACDALEYLNDHYDVRDGITWKHIQMAVEYATV